MFQKQKEGAGQCRDGQGMKAAGKESGLFFSEHNRKF